ncbi:MAG: NAD(P) transhydrogenase subunit alpha [bacterium]
MQIAIPRELDPAEPRVAATPATVGKLVKLGATVAIEQHLGAGSSIPDAEYEKAGATIVADRAALLGKAEIVLSVRKLPVEDMARLAPGTLIAGYYEPLSNAEGIRAAVTHQLTLISLEYLPRTTRAQKMDALSSQASLAGYVAVMLAANALKKIFPMQMTPAGTLAPSKVFIIGAGVAGLQAIATAHRLGARVEAFDTRPVVKEQVQSLGARFLEIDLGETGQTAGGYAKELTPEQLAIQQEGMAVACAASDIVITTAQVFGRKAPVLLKESVVQRMAPGSVIVDLAVESGGNVEGSVCGEIVDRNGVTIIGLANLPGRVATHASQMLSQNMFNLLDEYWDKKGTKRFVLNLDDEILTGCVLVHAGDIRNPQVKEAVEKAG